MRDLLMMIFWMAATFGAGIWLLWYLKELRRKG